MFSSYGENKLAYSLESDEFAKCRVNSTVWCKWGHLHSWRMRQQWGRVGIVKEMQERQRGLVRWRGWVLRSIEVLCNNGKTFHTKPERPARGTPQLLDSERRVCQKPLEGKMGYGVENNMALLLRCPFSSTFFWKFTIQISLVHALWVSMWWCHAQVVVSRLAGR